MGFPIGGEIKCTSSPSSVSVSVSFCDIQYEDRFVAIILNYHPLDIPISFHFESISQPLFVGQNVATFLCGFFHTQVRY